MPPDLPRLRVLATWLELNLDRVREAIEAAERRAAEEADRPHWWLQWMRVPAGRPARAVLHRRGCWCPGEPDLRAADVRRAAASHPGLIEGCPACRAQVPDDVGPGTA